MPQAVPVHRALKSRLIPRFPRALWVLLVAGALLRVFTMSYWPGRLFYDSLGYMYAADTDLFAAVEHPAGYPAFLRIVHTFSDQLAVLVVIQHLLGLATAALLYAALRRLRQPTVVCLVPAAVVLFNGDQLFYEHAVMSEALFGFLLAAELYAVVRATEERGLTWPLLAGVLLAGAALVRTAGLLLVPVALVWIFWRRSGDLRRRAVPVLVAAGAAAYLLVAYVAVQNDETGFTGFSRTAGWSLYARTAQFADCSKFDPPSGTAALCESTPPGPELRGGPRFHHWNPASPAWRAFGRPPAGDDKLGSFGRAAILNQPLDYLETVGNDLLDYVRRGARGASTWKETDFGVISPSLVASTLRKFGYPERYSALRYFAPVRVHTSTAGTLQTYQETVRVHGWLLAAMALLALAGIPLTRGPARAAIVLFALVGFMTLAVPVATIKGSWRYAIPAFGPLAAAAAVGLAAVLTWATGGQRSAHKESGVHRLVKHFESESKAT